jgi:hypothetical protein
MGNQLAKLQGDFLLESVGEEFQYSLLNWKVVSFPILKGGWGIWKLSISNQVLIGRWLWLSGYKSSHLWRHVICVKKVKARISGCVQCWEGHIYLSLKSLKAWETFLRIVNFVLGGRRTIRFGMILVHWCIFVEGALYTGPRLIWEGWVHEGPFFGGPPRHKNKKKNIYKNRVLDSVIKIRICNWHSSIEN